MITADRTCAKVASNWRRVMWALFAAILMAPLVAMQFTDEVRWNGFDFAAAAVLFFVLGISVELAFRAVSNPWLRAAVIVALVASGALLWADAAVQF
jgi:hypothetical protein